MVDLDGRTVMPGMVSSHFHATYHELGSKTAPFGLEEPPALQAVRAAHHLELLLRSGFTGAVTAGAPFAIDASMKAAIAEGLFPGPRLMAGSPTSARRGTPATRASRGTGTSAPAVINRSDGPNDFRRAAREEIKQGAEIIKMFVTGGHGTVAPSEQTEMTPRGDRGRYRGAASARRARCAATSPTAPPSTWRSTPASTWSTTATGSTPWRIERMVELGTFLVPSQLFPARFAEMMGGGGLGFTAAMAEDIERALAILPTANAAGVKLLCGDDYGAIGLPHGRYADELEFYVKEAGIAPLDVHPLGHPQRSRAHGPGPRARLGARGLPGRSPRRRRRPAGARSPSCRTKRGLLGVMKGGTLVKDESDALAHG